MSASLAHLREMLLDLLSAVPPVQIIIDGLDECDPSIHAYLIVEILRFPNSSTKLAKVSILSRDGGIVGGKLRKNPTLSLREESESMDKT